MNMVRLSRIVTKTGDAGETGLGDGSRIPKDHPRIAAIGAVDELNAVLGLIPIGELAEAQLLRAIQNDLFDLGADLCVPSESGEKPSEPLRVAADHIARLEHAVERLNENLPPLESFILPGGTPAAAWCHFARTVCRRAERDVVTLMRSEIVNSQVLIYLNRLSDLLFVLSRTLNAGNDVLWKPGGSDASSKRR
jgi:cob(I)alamin adenosyltransferase